VSGSLSERALILAPNGRDALVARHMLGEAGLRGHIVGSIPELVEALEAGAGCGVITEEALADTDLSALSTWLAAQPEWSDFPFVLLTQRGGGLERNPEASRYLEVLGNVTFLERPFHPTTFVSLAQSALRGRLRQYDARARLEELNQLASDLERRVEERTAEQAATVAQLHEAQKLETLGQLTGGVAHDFNNLLTPITGALDVLQRKFENDARTRRLLSNALQAAERARLLVQRLLGFARRQELQEEPVDLAALLLGMHDLISSSVGPTIELQLRCEPDLPAALADPNQLELAILNLCVNARDAMPGGGPLTILAEGVAIGPASSPPLKPGFYLRISVIDAGVGMDSETLARAIEPFYSTKETGRGTGLGLSMVHGLAGQLGGGFELTSAPGEGTRVDLYLRSAGQSARARHRSDVEAIHAVGRRLSILLIDDEDLVRAAIAEMIRDLGHDVTEASGGAEGIQLLREDPDFDAVITDYMMPAMHGSDVARQIASSHPHVPVLLITGYTGTADDTHNLPRLSKPFGQAEVAAALAALFADDDKVVRLRTPSRRSSAKGAPD